MFEGGCIKFWETTKNSYCHCEQEKLHELEHNAIGKFQYESVKIKNNNKAYTNHFKLI